MQDLTPEVAQELTRVLQGEEIHASLDMKVIYPRLADGADTVFSFLLLAGILSYAFGQEPMGMMWRMIGTGVFICLLPKIGEWVASQVVYLNLLVKHWLMS
jgi:hypothetical protein